MVVARNHGAKIGQYQPAQFLEFAQQHVGFALKEGCDAGIIVAFKLLGHQAPKALFFELVHEDLDHGLGFARPAGVQQKDAATAV